MGCPITAKTFAMPYWFNVSLAEQYTACNAEIAASVGDNAIFYSTHYASLDYVALFSALRASGTTKLAVYCLSYGTYFCNSKWHSDMTEPHMSTRVPLDFLDSDAAALSTAPSSRRTSGRCSAGLRCAGHSLETRGFNALE